MRDARDLGRGDGQDHGDEAEEGGARERDPVHHRPNPRQARRHSRIAATLVEGSRMSDETTNKMTHQENDKELQALLKREFPAIQNAELQRDLWPQMLRRLDAQPLRVPWFDWALAAALAAALLFFPGAIPALLYQL